MRNIQKVIRAISILIIAKAYLTAEGEEIKIGEHKKIPFGTFEFWLYIFYASGILISHLSLRWIDVRSHCGLLVD